MDERKIVKGFYESVRRTLFVSRIAGYLPVIGLMNENGKRSRCIWISKYSAYHVISLLLPAFFAVIHLNYALHTTQIFREGMIIRCFAVFSSVLLIRFSYTWEKMIKEIEDIERLLPPLKNPERIFKKINLILLFLLLFSVVNHIIDLTLTGRMTVLCYIKDDVSSLEFYYTNYYTWFFKNFSFTYVMAFLLQYTKFQTATVYYFVDFIVIVVTLYLVYRFRNFNRMMRIRQTKCGRNRNILWMDLQAHYTRLTRLVKTIDGYINPFVLLSFLSNLVLICKNIYDVIQKQKKISFITQSPDCITAHSFDWIVILESAVNITFLVFRTSSVSMLTAHLHTLSREPLKLLHTLPASAYTPEVQRFMDQVYHTKINLSGFGFFYVTRGTILAMFSTIVTYELVLLQLPVIYY